MPATTVTPLRPGRHLPFRARSRASSTNGCQSTRPNGPPTNPLATDATLGALRNYPRPIECGKLVPLKQEATASRPSFCSSCPCHCCCCCWCWCLSRCACRRCLRPTVRPPILNTANRSPWVPDSPRNAERRSPHPVPSPQNPAQTWTSSSR